MPEQHDLTISYDLPHCYLEVARGMMLSIHHPLDAHSFTEEHGASPLANAVFSIMSVTVIYSYLAVEAFVNGRLYKVWQTRHDTTPDGQRFIAILGDPVSFEELRHHRRVATLPERVKVLCEILQIPKPHEVDEPLWNTFTGLVNTCRNFLVHPTPAPNIFMRHMPRIMQSTPAGEYYRAAQTMIGHFFTQRRIPEPDWLRANTLLRFRGVDMLVGMADSR